MLAPNRSTWNTGNLRVGSSPTPLTHEQESTIRDMWAAGAYRDEIARAVGLGVDTINGARRRLGLPPRKRGPRPGSGVSEWVPSPEEIRAACLRIQAGWSAEEREVRLGLRDPDSREELPRSRGVRVVPADDLPGILAGGAP